MAPALEGRVSKGYSRADCRLFSGGEQVENTWPFFASYDLVMHNTSHDRLTAFLGLVERRGDTEVSVALCEPVMSSSGGTGDRLPELNGSGFFLLSDKSVGGVTGPLGAAP